MTIYCYPEDTVAYAGRSLRETMSVFLHGASATDPFGSYSGVRRGTSAATVTATSATWTVGAHAGVLDLEAAVEAGPYVYAVNAVGGLPSGVVTAAHATLPRVDIVYMRLDDPTEADGTATPLVAAAYLPGVANASPAPPATPARSMVLAQLNVPASGGGTPSVTWTAPILPAAGATMGTPAATATAGGFTVGATELRDSILPVYSFVAVAGRRYRAEVNGLIMSGTVVGDIFTARIRNGGASTPTPASALISTSPWFCPASGGGGQTSQYVSQTFVPGPGPVTLALFVARTSGTGVCAPLGTRELLAVDAGLA